MKKYLCLLALYPCMEASAAKPSLTFPEQKIELPALSLSGNPQLSSFSQPPTQTLPWMENFSNWTGGFPESLPEIPHRQAARQKPPSISADKFVITPADDVDYKVVVKHPDPNVDYKLTVKEAEVTSQK